MKSGSAGARIQTTAVSLARQPRFWLIAQLCAVIVAGACFGGWEVGNATDTASYVATSQAPLPEAMKSIRTLGYPVILKAASVFASDYRAIPWVHLALLCATVLLFDASLRRYGVSRWEAFFVTSGLLYAMLPWRTQIAYVLSDFPGMQMAVGSIACLFWLLGSPRSALAWLGITFAVFAAYSIRPAYLFLIVLVPFLGLVFSWLRERASLRSTRAWGFVAALVAACLGPLLTYCTARFMVIGRFGLVNFGGYTRSGLAAELLDAEIVGELPENHRRLAEAIRDRRAGLGMQSIFQGRFFVDLALFERQLSPDIFRVAVPAAMDLYGEDLLAHEPELLAFSREVIALRKGKYFWWMACYFPRALAKVICFQWSLWLFIPAAIALTFLRRFRALGPPWLPNGAYPGDGRILQSLLWLAPCYFLAGIGLLCLAGSPADSRLAVPPGVFLSPLLVLWCVREAKALGGRKREGSDLCSAC